MKKSILSFLLCGLAIICFAQNDSEKYEHGLFRGTRIVNGHSVETLKEGEMEMIIGHRFGRINGGLYELFGLDQANIRMGLDYGIKSWLTVGAGRSSLGKELDGFAKVRLLRQNAKGHDGIPFSLTLFSSVSYNTLRAADPARPIAYQNRFAYVNQVFIARKITERFSAQFIGAYAHYNLVENRLEKNDRVVLGLAAKYQLSKNLAFTGEYYYTLPGFLPADKQNSLSFGFDLNTGSHVFQLHFTNSAGMIEKQFIGETNGSWSNGDVHFGFNMVRTFKLRGRRY